MTSGAQVINDDIDVEMKEFENEYYFEGHQAEQVLKEL